MIMKFRFELPPDSTVKTISDFMARSERFHWKTQKRHEVYRIGAFSCKQEANPILNENGLV